MPWNLLRLTWLGSSLGQNLGQFLRLLPPRRRLSTGPRADRRRSSLNSALSIARNTILRPNITPSPRRVDGVRGPVTIRERRINRRGASPKPRRTRTIAKGRANGLIITLSLSLRPILRPKPLLHRLVQRQYDRYWTTYALNICPRIGMLSLRSGLLSPLTISVR